MTNLNTVSKDAVMQALASVMDPELGRPITDLDMVDSVEIEGNRVSVKVLLTTAGCPLRDTISQNIQGTVSKITGVSQIEVQLGVMSDEQKKALREKLTGHTENEIPFNRADSLTKVIAITSGKGGVGKSSVTANLAVALSKEGLKVGVLDADIYGFSMPRMLGTTNSPTTLDGMIIPPLGVNDVKVISIGMLVPESQPVIWRGPMLHRALQQFLADVFWGDLDVLLLDMPPGTGDVAISIAQLLPRSEILIVTTPQVAAAEVAERSGSIAAQTHQNVLGVVENMSHLVQPDGSVLEVFGKGGGQIVAKRLTRILGYEIPLLGQIPLEVELRQGGDKGVPVVASEPLSKAGEAIASIAKTITSGGRGLAGKRLGVSPVN